MQILADECCRHYGFAIPAGPEHYVKKNDGGLLRVEIALAAMSAYADHMRSRAVTEACDNPNRGLAWCTKQQLGDTDHFYCQTMGCPRSAVAQIEAARKVEG